MYKALDVATWFLYKNNSEQKEKVAVNDDYEVYDGITHLKLQKLLYNAQGVNLAVNGEVLFPEPLEAWEHGPVVRNIYDTFSIFGRNQIIIPITEETNEIVNKIESDNKVKNVLELVYDNFSIYTAWQLREMSHVENGPWYKTPRNQEINIDVLKDYFKREVVAE